MKHIKTVTDGLPEGYSIEIKSEFRNKFPLLFIDEEVVKITGYLDKGNDCIKVHTEYVLKPKTYRNWLFIKKRPRHTWKELCEIHVEKVIDYLINVASEAERLKRINSELFNSLDEL